jgi:hypothetical protein
LAEARARKRTAYVQRVMRLISADFERAASPPGMAYKDILDMVAGPHATTEAS